MKNPNADIRVLDRDKIKYSAIIAMAIGHFIGYFPFIMQFISDEALRRDVLIALISIADFAPPVFFFFVAEGFLRTKSRKKYALRLLAFTLISQVPYCLMKRDEITVPGFFQSWNVIATLFLGVLSLFVWNSKMRILIGKVRTLVKVLIIVLIDVFTMLIKSEWTVFGIPMILGFYIFRDRAKARFIWFISLVSLQQFVFFANSGFNIQEMISKGYPIQVAALLLGYFAVTKLYNGKKGKNSVFSKWFFYIFYPVHMLVIFLLRKVLKTR